MKKRITGQRQLYAYNQEGVSEILYMETKNFHTSRERERGGGGGGGGAGKTYTERQSCSQATKACQIVFSGTAAYRPGPIIMYEQTVATVTTMKKISMCGEQIGLFGMRKRD